MRKFLALLDDWFWRMGDDLTPLTRLAEHFLSKVLSLSGLFVLLGLGFVGAVVFLIVRKWLFLQRLPEVRANALADEKTTPILEVSSDEDSGRAGVRFRVDKRGVTLHLGEARKTVEWQNVQAWDRVAPAEWSFRMGDRWVLLTAGDNVRLRPADKDRIDARIALHVGGRPHSSELREWLRSILQRRRLQSDS